MVTDDMYAKAIKRGVVAARAAKRYHQAYAAWLNTSYDDVATWNARHETVRRALLAWEKAVAR